MTILLQESVGHSLPPPPLAMRLIYLRKNEIKIISFTNPPKYGQKALFRPERDLYPKIYTHILLFVDTILIFLNKSCLKLSTNIFFQNGYNYLYAKYDRRVEGGWYKVYLLLRGILHKKLISFLQISHKNKTPSIRNV